MIHNLSLNGDWLLTRVGSGEAVPAQVPGCVHTDLMRAGSIPDPLYRDNEASLLWIGETDWQYERAFEVPPALLDQPYIRLVCAGLDTLATLTLNGTVIGTADNMYRTWEYDLKPVLRAGKNTLVIRFDSPLNYLRRRDREERMLPAWVGNDKVHGGGWLRKEPCNFGWDWGPRVVTSGIWRDISIQAFDARLTDVKIDQQHGQDQVALEVTIDSQGTPAGSRAHISVWGQDGPAPLASADTPVIEGRAVMTVPIHNPQLWWVNGMGSQPLYTVRIDLLAADEQTLDRREKRIGLRTLTLDRHADAWGESFQFLINGVPFFAKGANWIPADVFAARMTSARYQRLIEDTAAAHMNMLRVWGGGIYEDDAFYDWCDQYGIAIWQDFMFACGTYPGFDEAFCANVAAEATENIQRLRHHACIALWCGNNELEQGLVGDEWTARTMSWQDYSRLFDQVLPQTVRQVDPARPYWPSSPHNPTGDRYQHSNPESGDSHLWDVWHGKKPFEWYRTCYHRFASEFGFQSFPEPATMNTVTLPEDRNITSYVMEYRQRSGIGNTTIMQYLLDWFRLPTGYTESLWLTQILQGMAMKYAIEHWRRNMPRTMGTLYWQLNDCWEAPSWASIDYHGRWKALHYMAKRFYAPLLISGVEDPDTGTVAVHLTSDSDQVRAGLVHWTVTTAAGEVLEQGQVETRTPRRGSQQVATLDLNAALSSHGARDLIVWLKLEIDGQMVSENQVLFARPKHLRLVDPGIRTVIRPLGAGCFEVRLEADKPALWVWLSSADSALRCSDNFFHLQPGQPRTIVASFDGILNKEVTDADLAGQIRVQSLMATYAESSG